MKFIFSIKKTVLLAILALAIITYTSASFLKSESKNKEDELDDFEDLGDSKKDQKKSEVSKKSGGILSNIMVKFKRGGTTNIEAAAASTTTTPDKAHRTLRKESEGNETQSTGTVQAPTEASVRAAFKTQQFDSHDYIVQHIAEMKSAKIDLSKIRKEFIRYMEAVPVTEIIKPVSKFGLMKTDIDELLFDADEMIETPSEVYMYDLIKKNEGITAEEGKKTNGEVEPTKSWDEIFKELFTTQDRPFCKTNPNLRMKTIHKKPEEGQVIVSKLPSKKQNVNYKAWGVASESAYVFDFLDYGFQERMVKAFEHWWKQCQTLPPKIGVEDPYTLLNQLTIEFNRKGGKAPFPLPTKEQSITDLINSMKKLKPTFDESDWILNISIPQLATIYDKFRWVYNRNDSGFFQKLLDKYDYDGDGRLDAREFIFLTIWENRKEVRSSRTIYPFYKIQDKYINPMFQFADCTKKGYIVAEQLWATFHNLKRQESTTNDDLFNFFDCEVPNGYTHTSAVNDFVLKCANTIQGALNPDEFATCIMLGYWDRQISVNKIVSKDEMNKKSTRWKDDKIDIICEKMKQISGK